MMLATIRVARASVDDHARRRRCPGAACPRRRCRSCSPGSGCRSSAGPKTWTPSKLIARDHVAHAGASPADRSCRGRSRGRRRHRRYSSRCRSPSASGLVPIRLPCDQVAGGRRSRRSSRRSACCRRSRWPAGPVPPITLPGRFVDQDADDRVAERRIRRRGRCRWQSPKTWLPSRARAVDPDPGTLGDRSVARDQVCPARSCCWASRRSRPRRSRCRWRPCRRGRCRSGSPGSASRVEPPWTTTPTEPLPEITLVPSMVTPMELSVEPRSTQMPSSPLPMACEPVLSVPIEVRGNDVPGGTGEQVDAIGRVAGDDVAGPDRLVGRRHCDDDPVDPGWLGGRAGGVEPDQVADDMLSEAACNPQSSTPRVELPEITLPGRRSATDDDVGTNDQDTHTRGWESE